jgi:hypothetical protein
MRMGKATGDAGMGVAPFYSGGEAVERREAVAAR